MFVTPFVTVMETGRESQLSWEGRDAWEGPGVL